MTEKQQDEPKNTAGEQDESKKTVSKGSDHIQPFTAGNNTPEIATNDGSVIETLDTAFHGVPGWSEGENLSGSNRADYYEARSSGKSDVEEEMEEIRKQNRSNDAEKKEE